MTEAAKAAADSQEVHPLQLANQIIDLINARGIPHEQRTKVLDGLLHAYLQTAQHVGLFEVAALVMWNEGGRLLGALGQQHAQATAMDAAANTPASVLGSGKLH